MIIKFEFGLTFDGVIYGWKRKKLYRLPQIIGKGFYPLIELTLINVGNGKGYNLKRKKKSLKQIKDMTIFIDYKYQDIKDENCPF